MRLTALALAFALPGLPAAAQEGPDFAALDARLRYRLDDAGKILIAPNPAMGDDESGFTPLVEFTNALANAGVLGMAMLAFMGDTDFASLTDAEAFFGRLDRDDDASLLQTISDPSASILERLLAVRRVQDRDLKPAIGALQKIEPAKTADVHLRRAVAEALASLRGQPSPVSTAQLPELASALARAPARSEAFVYVDHRRLPPARRLSRLARIAGIEITKREIRRLAARVSLTTWAGATRLSDAIGALPYETARVFGNGRVHRVVYASRVMTDRPQVGWSHIAGEFDLAGLRRGLAASNFEVRGSDDRLQWAVEMVDVAMTATAVEVDPAGAGARIGAKRAAAIAAEILGEDKPAIAVYLRPHVSLAGMLPERFAQLGRPVRLAVWVPRDDEGRVRARLTFSTAQGAGVLAGLVKSAPRHFERALDGLDPKTAERFEPLLSALERMKVEQEGPTVTVSLSLAGVDLGEMFVEAIRSSLFS